MHFLFKFTFLLEGANIKLDTGFGTSFEMINSVDKCKKSYPEIQYNGLFYSVMKQRLAECYIRLMSGRHMFQSGGNLMGF